MASRRFIIDVTSRAPPMSAVINPHWLALLWMNKATVVRLFGGAVHERRPCHGQVSPKMNPIQKDEQRETWRLLTLRGATVPSRGEILSFEQANAARIFPWRMTRFRDFSCCNDSLRNHRGVMIPLKITHGNKWNNCRFGSLPLMQCKKNREYGWPTRRSDCVNQICVWANSIQKVTTW